MENSMNSTQLRTQGPSGVAPLNATKASRILGILVIVIGIGFFLGGSIGWFTVKSQLADEQITVSDNGESHAGKKVEGPFTAFAQANAVKKDVLEATAGRTFAQLEMDEPVREMALQGASVRTSLLTSALSFGVSSLAASSGISFVLLGSALILRTRRD